MATDADRLNVIRQLESALADLRAVSFKDQQEANIASFQPMGGTINLPPIGVGSQGTSSSGLSRKELSERLDAAENLVQQIALSDSLSDVQKSDFRKLASSAIQENMRGLARGIETVSAVNVTVSGTGTISV